MKKLLAPFLLLSVLFCFQNCAPGRFDSLMQPLREETATTGNLCSPPCSDPAPEKLKTVFASSLLNREDIAPELQAAINDPDNQVVIFDGPPGTEYISSKFQIRSNLIFHLMKGVTLRAKPGAFPNEGDMFIFANNVKNVTVSGEEGSVIRMNKSEYEDTPDDGREAVRTTLVFYSSENVTIKNIELRDSGGDGILITDSSSTQTRPSRNVLIDSVISDNSSRNALSVISVDGLIIKNSVFSNTRPDKAALKGPWDGIDFEPNSPANIFKNILVENCLFYGNANKGIDLHFFRLNSSSEPVSLTLRNNIINDSEFAIIAFASEAPNNYKGLVKIEGVITNSKRCKGGDAVLMREQVDPETYQISGVLCQARSE
jgi:hypothetical protein